MSYSWKINPDTGDYIMEKGAPVEDPSLNFPIYARYRIRRNTWLYAPDTEYGSDFHLIKKRHSGTIARSMITTSERALQPLLDDGRATKLEVELVPEAQGRHASGIQTKIRESESQVDRVVFTPILGGE